LDAAALCVGNSSFNASIVKGFVKDVATLEWLSIGQEKAAKKFAGMTKPKLFEERALLTLVCDDFFHKLLKWRVNFGLEVPLPPAVRNNKKKFK
jgi:hypothetical protein